MLQQQLAATYDRALREGAILPLQIESDTVQEGALNYDVTWVSSLSLKDMAAMLQRAKPVSDNPFLPHEEALYVGDLTPTHMALLNKFPMEPRHVMAVTKAYVPQLAPLDASDFDALATLLLGAGGYAMFNGGPVAGASQGHRHLHVLPSSRLPFEPLFPTSAPVGQVTQVPFFDFPHAFVPLAPATDTAAVARHMQAAHAVALAHCGLQAHNGEMPPFNVLATPRWWLLVPRTQVSWTGSDKPVSVYSLHYGGLVGVRERSQMEAVKQAGLLHILRSVSGVASTQSQA